MPAGDAAGAPLERPLQRPGAEPASARTLRALVEFFPAQSVVVAGDVMLDHFVIGRVQRISPEAPVPVVEHRRDEFRLGGAANVANNVRALGAHPVLIGIVGQDDAASQLRALLDAGGIDGSRLVADPRRPTTRKVRIVTDRHQQVARVDYESDADAPADVESAIVDHVTAAASDGSVVVISDYLKGCVTRGLMRALIAAASVKKLKVLVDPKIPHLDYYAGAALVTPNHHEAEVATHRRIRSDEDARGAARAFRERAQCESVVITRGEQGLWLLEGEAALPGAAPHAMRARSEISLPARAREVADVTGAGDTVIAALAVAIAAGGTLAEAAELANHAAGVAVGRFGPAAVSSQELLQVLGSHEF